MEEERKKEREKGKNSAARVHAKPFGFYADPSVLRSPVRASFAMLRSDKHPPLGPSAALHHPSVPLSKSTERSLTRAARRAQPPLRPHRDLTAVVNAEIERERSPRHVFVPHDRSSSHLAVAAHLPLPHESDFSFFSPPPPPSSPPSPPPPNLEILSHRPPAAIAILAFAVLVAPLSPKDPRVVPSGSTPVRPVPSFEIRGSLLRSSSSSSRGSA